MMGGLVGGPVTHRLIERLKARGAPLGVSKSEAMTHDAAESTAGAFTPQRLTVTILLIAASVAIGNAVSRLAENPTFTLPTFVWTLFVGAMIRNGLALAKLHEIDGEALCFAGTISLSLFLAMALMSLRLWELAALAVPIFVILRCRRPVSRCSRLSSPSVSWARTTRRRHWWPGNAASVSERRRPPSPTCRRSASATAMRRRHTSSCPWSAPS